jgi:hypothetical protein
MHATGPPHGIDWPGSHGRGADESPGPLPGVVVQPSALVTAANAITNRLKSGRGATLIRLLIPSTPMRCRDRAFSGAPTDPVNSVPRGRRAESLAGWRPRALRERSLLARAPSGSGANARGRASRAAVTESTARSGRDSGEAHESDKNVPISCAIESRAFRLTRWRERRWDSSAFFPAVGPASPRDKAAPSTSRDASTTRKDALPIGRASSPIGKASSPNEHDALPKGNAALPSENDAPPLRNDALPIERDEETMRNAARPIEKEACCSEKDATPTEHDALPKENAALPSENGAPPIRNDALAIERAAFANPHAAD